MGISEQTQQENTLKIITTGVAKTDSRTRSHNTKALTEVSMKMFLGTLFLYLC